MNIGTNLLKADRVGVRDLKEHLSSKLLKKILIVTEHGDPVSVNIPYSEIMELVDIIDEIIDKETFKIVHEARKAIKAGTKGVSVTALFKRIRKKR